MNFDFFTFLVLIFYCVNSAYSSCPKFPSRKGIAISCKNPINGAEVDCTNRDPPEGTAAIYKCLRYYVSAFGDTEGGRMSCNSNGNWARKSQYDEFVCRIDCGKPAVTLLTASPVIVFGEVATGEEFPWYTAIFRRDGNGEPFHFLCGGSLINPANKEFLVITAAHCVSNTMRSKRVRPIGDYKIVLGPVSSDYATNLGSNRSQIFSVKKAVIHPNYDYDLLQSDLGLFLLDREPKLSEVTLPVCFPSKGMANKEIKGTGMLAGFGVDETTQISKALNFAKLPVTDVSVCNRALGKELTSIEFCAGFAHGASVCSGDSGGGLIFLDPLSKRLFIQGITSNVDLRPLTQLKYCQNYNTFTRVTSFVEWVYDTVDEWTCDDCDLDFTGISNGVQSFVSKLGFPQAPASDESFRVTVYENIKDKSKYTEWKMRKCSSLPSNWNNDKQFWVDIHGQCLQFYEGIYCSGRSLVLQPTPESSTFRWNFPDYSMRSVSVCEETASDGNGNSGNTASGGSTIGEDHSYEAVGLRAHNLYRMKHGTPPVRLSDKLNIQAKSRADELIRQIKLEPSREGGENLFEITGSQEDSPAIVQQAVQMWYNTIENYSWRDPQATSFSQIVWKSTSDIGIGVSRSGARTIVVAKYSPPGNVYYYGPNGDRAKYFRENVLRPR